MESKYTIYFWKNEKDYKADDNVESRPVGNADLNLLIAAENTRCLNEEIFAFEIIENGTGKLFYNSHEE